MVNGWCAGGGGGGGGDALAVVGTRVPCLERRVLAGGHIFQVKPGAVQVDALGRDPEQLEVLRGVVVD